MLALRARVCAVSDHARENMAYKRSTADSAIEVAEDKVGVLSLEVRNEHTGCLVWHKLRVQTGARDIYALRIPSSNSNHQNGYY